MKTELIHLNSTVLNMIQNVSTPICYDLFKHAINKTSQVKVRYNKKCLAKYSLEFFF